MTLTKLRTDEGFDWRFYDYTLALEKEWQASSSRFTDKELLEIFPEAKQIIPEKIEEWEQERAELSEAIKKTLTLIKYKITDEFSQWFWREWIKVNEGQELLRTDDHIVRLKRLLAIAQERGLKGKIMEEKIQQALRTPIENIANQYLKLRKSGKALVGLCPFHPEKHPSFYIYPETNSCWCYGCNQGGNVINFVRLLSGCSFVEAVEYLIGEKMNMSMTNHKDQILEQKIQEIEKSTSEKIEKKENQEGGTMSLKPISLQELMQKDFPETQWVIEKLIPTSSVSALSGYAGACKTWIALQMAIEVARGGRLFDQFSASQSPVLLIDEETGEKWIKKRIEMLGGGKDLPIYILSKRGFRLEKDRVTEMLEFCKEKEIKFLIIDSFAQVNTADNENDALEAVKVLRQMQRFCQEGIAVLFIHHHRKPQSYQGSLAHDMRGSSAILAAVDVHLVSEYRKKEGTVIITQDKMRHDKELQPFKLTIISDENSYSLEFNDFIEPQETFTEKYKEAIEESVKALEMPIHQKELLSVLRPRVGGGESAFFNAVKQSVAEGKIFDAKGGYRNKKYLWHSPITDEILEKIETQEKEKI